VLLGDAFLAAALVDLVQTPVEVADRELVEILVLRRPDRSWMLCKIRMSILTPCILLIEPFSRMFLGLCR
jgi:hypothetical protein